MNRAKNGIPIATKPKMRNGSVYKSESNDYRRYVTLTRLEGFQKVWLVQPFIGKEVNLLKKDGWNVVEVWERGSVVDEIQNWRHREI